MRARILSGLPGSAKEIAALIGYSEPCVLNHLKAMRNQELVHIQGYRVARSCLGAVWQAGQGCDAPHPNAATIRRHRLGRACAKESMPTAPVFTAKPSPDVGVRCGYAEPHPLMAAFYGLGRTSVFRRGIKSGIS